MNILFLTSRIPYPPYRGDKLRILNLIKQLSRRGHSITLRSFIASKREEAYIEPLREFCCDVKTVMLTPVQSVAQCAATIFSRDPFQIAYFRSARMDRLIEETLAAKHIDIVHVHLIRMAQYGLKINSHPRVLDLTDAGSLYLQRFFDVTKSPVKKIFLREELKRLSRYEHVWTEFEASLVCSEVDKRVLEQKSGGVEVGLLYNTIDISNFPYDPARAIEPNRIIFTGNMTYYPNEDGILYFVKEIFPKIVLRHPKAELYIVGQNPPRSIRDVAAHNIVVTGFVPDIKVEYSKSAVSVAPIRFGAGTLTKILEPMAMGIPIVATSMGAEGLPVKHGRDILIADTPDEYAEAVVRLLNNTQLQHTLGSSAAAMVRSTYSSETIAGSLEKTYQDVMEKWKHD
jgi:polysaccharide biosynthesis protein PslH